MNSRREAGCGLVVPGPNRTELLDFGEDILDLVPFPVGVSVKGARKYSVFPRRNHRLNSTFCEQIQQGVRVKVSITDQCRELHRVQERRYRDEIVALVGQDDKTDQFSNYVRQRDHLARQTAF